MKTRLILIALSLCFISNSILVTNSYSQIEELRLQFAQDHNRQNNELRKKYMHVNEVIDILNIKPNMTILDIGAGEGLFTFPLANALKGTGKVYATDIDKSAIAYLKNLKEINSVENVYPVLVSSESSDKFYKSHTFDIIFACEIYYYLFDQRKFFKDLKYSLNDNGTLYIISPNLMYKFTEALLIFNNSDKLIDDLKNKDNIEIFQRLSKKTKKLLNKWVPGTLKSPLWQSLLKDLNQMLSDRTLYPSLMRYYAKEEKLNKFNALEKINKYHLSLLVWLAENLENEGVFSSNKPLSQFNKERLNRLNSLLITGSLQSEMSGVIPRFYLAKKNEIIYTLESAGYEFVKEYPIIPTFYFLEFKKNNN